MKKSIYLSLLLLSIFVTPSCKKPGLGGDATVVAFPKHHGKAIFGATVYVKFDAVDFPGSDAASYDATFIGAASEDHVHIEELKQGNYYLYAVGYDSSIKQMVYGGQSVKIKRKDRNSEKDMDIAVTE